MPTIYVDDTASGSNDGTSDTDAYTSISSVSASDGDRILIAHTHDEAVSGDLDKSSNTFASWLSVDYGDSFKLRPGAQFTSVQDLAIGGYIFGITFEHGSSSNSYFWDSESATFEECTRHETAANSRQDYRGKIELINCALDTSGSGTIGHLFAPEGLTDLTIRNLDISSATKGSYASAIEINVALYLRVIIEDCDWSSYSYTNFAFVVGTLSAQSYIRFKNVRIFSYTNITATAPTEKLTHETQGIEFVNSYSGTETDPSYHYLFKDYWGECELQETVTRLTTDGVNSKTYKLTAYEDRCWEDTYLCARTGPMMVYVPEDATTVTIHVAHTGVGGGTSGDLTNEEFWVEVSSPSEAGTATAQGQWESTKNNFGTVTDLDDAATGEVWSGGSLTVYQKIDVTIAPTEAGWVTVTAFFALQDASSDNTVYVDFPEVS